MYFNDDNKNLRPCNGREQACDRADMLKEMEMTLK